MRPTILLLSVIVILSGCTQTGTGPVTSQLYKIYNNPHYTISYPADWTPEEQGPVVMFKSPQQGPSDAGLENVNIVVVPAGTKDLEEYVMSEIDNLREVTPNFKLLDYGKDPISLPSRKIVYTEDDGQNKYQYMQIIAQKDNKYYILSYTALMDTFPTYVKIATDMISSFKTKAEPIAVSTTTPKTQAASPYPGLTKNWRVYSQAIFYDSGGFNFMDTPATRLLELKPDYTWTFGNSEGTWRVSKITETDWTKWGVNAYGPTEKLVLDGWNNDVADGPIEGNVDFLWVIYRTGPPTVQSPAQIQIKFGLTNR